MPKTQLPRFAQTPLPSFAELMRRIESAAKKSDREESTVHRARLSGNVRQGSMKFVMASLDDAGKTTNLYRMTLDTATTVTPATSSNVKRELTVWDIGGQ